MIQSDQRWRQDSILRVHFARRSSLVWLLVQSSCVVKCCVIVEDAMNLRSYVRNKHSLETHFWFCHSWLAKTKPVQRTGGKCHISYWRPKIPRLSWYCWNVHPWFDPLDSVGKHQLILRLLWNTKLQKVQVETSTKWFIDEKYLFQYFWWIHKAALHSVFSQSI